MEIKLKSTSHHKLRQPRGFRQTSTLVAAILNTAFPQKERNTMPVHGIPLYGCSDKSVWVSDAFGKIQFYDWIASKPNLTLALQYPSEVNTAVTVMFHPISPWQVSFYSFQSCYCDYCDRLSPRENNAPTWAQEEGCLFSKLWTKRCYRIKDLSKLQVLPDDLNDIVDTFGMRFAPLEA